LAGEYVKDEPGAVPDAGTVMVADLEFDPALFVAVRVTVKVPEVEKACVGLRCEDVAVPSPNVQNQLVGLFSEVSVNCTVCPIVGLDGVNVKLATGAEVVTVTVLEVVLEPRLLVAVKETV
jgi:hypothetical protein